MESVPPTFFFFFAWPLIEYFVVETSGYGDNGWSLEVWSSVKWWDPTVTHGHKNGPWTGPQSTSCNIIFCFDWFGYIDCYSEIIFEKNRFTVNYKDSVQLDISMNLGAINCGWFNTFEPFLVGTYTPFLGPTPDLLWLHSALLQVSQAYVCSRRLDAQRRNAAPDVEMAIRRYLPVGMAIE